MNVILQVNHPSAQRLSEWMSCAFDSVDFMFVGGKCWLEYHFLFVSKAYQMFKTRL